MMTFDEAIEGIKEQRELIDDLNKDVVSRYNNPTFRYFIMQTAALNLNKILDLVGDRAEILTICAQMAQALECAFVSGLAVGRLMERVEIKEDMLK